MFTIKLLSTFSRLGRTVIPDGFLSRHQEKTFEVLKDPTVEVVFNTAMTGDGKSLAAYWPALKTGTPTIGLYPTNELGRDQKRQIENDLGKYCTAVSKPRVERITADRLRSYEADENISKQASLLSLMSGEIVVTNPDIYHYVFKLFYLRGKENPDKVFSRVVENFPITVFDEFHIFRIPQIVSVVNTMLLIRRTKEIGERKFLFLSATPSPLMVEMLERVGVKYKSITGEYQHLDDAAGAQANRYEWRRILHGVTLNFDIVGPDKSAETWVKEHFESHLLPFFQQQKGARGAIIVNSVATAKRLTAWLKEKLPPGLTAESNTGADSESTRRASYEADLLVGTSTIDVGVDFAINFLVFEALDAGSFIQRFGRLGRHNQNRDGVVFHAFQAYALLPNYICERLFGKDSTVLLKDGETYDRTTFFDCIRNECVFPPQADFRLYASKWGSLQAAYIHQRLRDKVLQNAYALILPLLDGDFEKALRIKMGKAIGRMTHLGKTNEGKLIFQEAQSFRGTSPLLCGVQDDSENKVHERFKTYDLPGVISNWEILEVMTQEQFLERVRKGGADPKKFDWCGLFLRIGRLREERAGWWFYINRELGINTFDLNAINGLEVLIRPGNGIEYVNEINRKLRLRNIVSFLVLGSPQENKIRRHLPALFGLYPLADLYTKNDANPPFSIAFGQEALQLATLYWKDSAKDGGAVVC